MPHRDALVAARERISALERELEDARARNGASSSELVERLTEEKRGLQAERARLVIERDRLTDDLARAKAALTKAEEANASVRRELELALQIRDSLRRQAIDGAARAGEARRQERESQLPPAPAKPTATAPVLDAHNLALPALEPPKSKRAGVLCPACHARKESVEMHTTGLTIKVGEGVIASVICPRCGHSAGKLGG